MYSIPNDASMVTVVVSARGSVSEANRSSLPHFINESSNLINSVPTDPPCTCYRAKSLGDLFSLVPAALRHITTLGFSIDLITLILRTFAPRAVEAVEVWQRREEN